jgi:hypothetical protein
MKFFYNPFEHIWFKSVFDLKNDGFFNKFFFILLLLLLLLLYI